MQRFEDEIRIKVLSSMLIMEYFKRKRKRGRNLL